MRRQAENQTGTSYISTKWLWDILTGWGFPLRNLFWMMDLYSAYHTHCHICCWILYIPCCLRLCCQAVGPQFQWPLFSGPTLEHQVDKCFASIPLVSVCFAGRRWSHVLAGMYSVSRKEGGWNYQRNQGEVVFRRFQSDKFVVNDHELMGDFEQSDQAVEVNDLMSECLSKALKI